MVKQAAGQRAEWKRFEHPVAFWFGAAACGAGVALHLPMYYSSRAMGYRMAGMRPDAAMLAGMALIGVGLLASLYGLLPGNAGRIQASASRVRIRALDEAPIRFRHVALLVVISVAIVIDVMKPAALAFVAPGMAREYGLRSAANPHGHVPVALLPLFGIGGTVIGSWMWGWLADRIGRRSSILYAGILFVSTSICGAMPAFNWNLLMCFFMGIGAGGMLPITFALLAETIPARHRSWLILLAGGFIGSVGFLLTSWLAGLLTPHYSWRILWLIGLPTGGLFIALNCLIPESPRFLLAAGRRAEAARIMELYGAEVVTGPDDAPAQDGKQPRAGHRQLFGGPFLGPTVAITILALGTGLIAYGFQLWIPTNLQHLGYTAVSSDYVVRNAALLGLPFGLLATVLYGFWSSKKTMIVFFSLLTAALLGFVIAGDSVAHDHALLIALLVIPLAGVTLVAAIVTAYASELYPTRIRSRGTGLVAGVTKVGGVLIIALVAAAATTPSIAQAALIGTVPAGAGIAVFAVTGRETRSRRLEEISQGELAVTALASGHSSADS